MYYKLTEAEMEKIDADLKLEHAANKRFAICFVSILIICIVGFLMLPPGKPKAEPTPYHKGDFVRVRVNGEIGQVDEIYDWNPPRIVIRMPNLDYRTFEIQELEGVKQNEK